MKPIVRDAEDKVQRRKRMQKEWKQKNPKKTRAYQLEWNRKNRAKIKKYRDKWIKNNPEKYENKRLKYNYGITVEEFNQMYVDQSGKCPICGKSGDRKLCVDHDHTTNKVRGLLCNFCNRGIGLFYENPDYLSQAIKYLKKHGK